MSIQIRVISAALAAAVLAGAGAVRADTAGVQFAAEVERRAPDGQVQKEKVFVGDGRTRLERSFQGQETVLISNRKTGTDYLLLPAEKRYMERTVAPGAPGAAAATPPAPTPDTDPCAGVPGLSCKRIGTEAVNGREAVKWELTMTDRGQTLTATQWLDVQRPGMPLKQVMPNGQTMELKMVGAETLDGRKTEKWEMTQTVPNQPPAVSRQWYDPELKRPVREEFPGGYVSTLTNIRVGSQPDALFTVPDGFVKKDPPPPSGGMAPGGMAPGAPPAGGPPQPGR